MKALVFNTPHQPVEFKEMEIPKPSLNEVLIKMKSAALNHRDIWMTQGLYPVSKSGVIQGSCGAGELDGREVIINPNLNWGSNPRYPDHNQYQILGVPTNGTFAQYHLTKEDRLQPKPSHLSWVEAGALPLAGLTAYSALFTKSKCTKEDVVLINGIGGGVALFAFQFALAAGAKVFVTSSSEQKIEKAKEMGASGGICYTRKDWDKVFDNKFGKVDIIIDSAGGNGFDSLLSIANPLARIVIYGGTQGKACFMPRKLFWKELQIMGSTMGSDIDFEKMLAFVSKYQIKPIIDSVFPLSKAEQGYQRMVEGKQFGKIVFEIP